jgi:poly-gamma-glutamate capsule biosynthesis protein CapA/YwtB (metallophosphatase superfamily)
MPRLVNASHLRSLLPAGAVLVPALAVLAIVLAPAPGRTTAGGAAAAEAAAAPHHTHAHAARARTITIGWVGDITPGSRYGLPARGGRALFAAVRRTLREPDVMAGNLEGTLSAGGASKCGAAPAAGCFAFQAPPANAAALRDAGLDLVNLANNHSFDFGADGRMQTLRALTGAGVAFTGLPGDVRVLERHGIRVAFAGFSTYRWTPSMDDPAAIRAVVGQAAAIADVVVVLFHAGAEGSDRTAVPLGREWAYGEDRGDSRAFAHAAIDAGADLVLGSGPHVIRGLETYRGRLIAYSLGNFAGVHNFATGGTLSTSGVLTVRVDRRGRLRNGWWHGIALDGAGTPHADRGASRTLVAALSARDFGATAARVLPSGRILGPAGERR